MKADKIIVRNIIDGEFIDELRLVVTITNSIKFEMFNGTTILASIQISKAAFDELTNLRYDFYYLGDFSLMFGEHNYIVYDAYVEKDDEFFIAASYKIIINDLFYEILCKIEGFNTPSQSTIEYFHSNQRVNTN